MTHVYCIYRWYKAWPDSKAQEHLYAVHRTLDGANRRVAGYGLVGENQTEGLQNGCAIRTSDSECLFVVCEELAD